MQEPGCEHPGYDYISHFPISADVNAATCAMIFNKICPYCSCVLLVAENQPNSRSVEHLVPNAVLSHKRGNDKGDFYACRRCNSKKSKIDYVLSVVAKTQSRDPKIASDSLVQAISKMDGRVKPFTQMLQTVNETIDGGATMEIPIAGADLLEYMIFLGKGQYFKRHLRVLDARHHTVLCRWYSKHVTATFEVAYEEKFGANNFRDLEKNLYTEVIAPKECMIYSKNNNYLFLFHDYIGIAIEVKSNNKKNIERAARLNADILKDFPAMSAAS